VGGASGVTTWDATGTVTHCNDYTQGTKGGASVSKERMAYQECCTELTQ